MSAWVWALTFTVLGAVPEHGTMTKYPTRKDCEESLQALKADYRQKGKNLVGSCTLILKSQRGI